MALYTAFVEEGHLLVPETSMTAENFAAKRPFVLKLHVSPSNWAFVILTGYFSVA